MAAAMPLSAAGDDPAAAHPADSTSAPRQRPSIDSNDRIFVLTGKSSGYGKETDRTDPRIGWQVLREVPGNQTRRTPPVRLLEDSLEIDHALL